MKREDVYKLIDGERDYQDAMGAANEWGEGQGAANHSPGDFIVFMQSYLRKAEDAASSQTGWEGALNEIRKVAALAVACMETNGSPPRDVRWVHYVVAAHPHTVGPFDPEEALYQADDIATYQGVSDVHIKEHPMKHGIQTRRQAAMDRLQGQLALGTKVLKKTHEIVQLTGADRARITREVDVLKERLR